MPLHESWGKVYPAAQTEIDEHIEEEEAEASEGLLAAEDSKSGYVPPQISASSRASSSQSKGPSWYYKSVPTENDPSEVENSKSFKGWDAETESKHRKGDLESAVIAAAVSNPDIALSLASGVVSAAKANPDLAANILGLGSSDKKSDVV